MNVDLTERVRNLEVQVRGRESDVPDRRGLYEFVAVAAWCVGEMADAFDGAGQTLPPEFDEKLSRLRYLAARRR